MDMQTLRARFGKRQVALALGVIAAAAALAWAFAPRPVPVEVAVVERARYEQWIEEDGRTRVKDRYTIAAPVSARVARITLREGDAVKAGDTVAVLMPAVSGMVDERSAREAQARLQAAQAGVALAQAREASARIALEQATLELHRTDKLAREGFMAPARLDSARLAVDAAKRDAEAAAAQRDVATHERDQAQAMLQPVNAAAGGQAVIVRSPVSGVVLRIPQQSEATVGAGAALLDVGDTSRMEVIAQLLTTDAVQAKPGTRVAIERWGGPAASAVVHRVEPGAFTKVSALGIEEQRVNVVIDVPNPPGQWQAMGDGFRVTVRVITASADEALVVPVGAIFPFADGGTAVYMLDGNRARLHPIEIDGRNGTVARVKAGLAAGDRVVIYPPPSVADGKRVELRAP